MIRQPLGTGRRVVRLRSSSAGPDYGGVPRTAPDCERAKPMPWWMLRRWYIDTRVVVVCNGQQVNVGTGDCGACKRCEPVED